MIIRYPINFKSISLPRQINKYLSIMNQEDERFFRENFSADSFSDASDSETPHATYEKTTFKVKLPGWSQKESVNIIKKLRSSQDYSALHESRRIRSDGTLILSTENPRRESQLMMLQKFRAEIHGITHMNEDPIIVAHSDGEDRKPVETEIKVKDDIGHMSQMSRSGHSNQASKGENQKNRNQISQMLEDSRRSQRARVLEQHQGETDRLISRIHEFQEILKEKDSVIKRLRRSEEDLKEEYRVERGELQTQIEKSLETVGLGLRQELIEKENEISRVRMESRYQVGSGEEEGLKEEIHGLKQDIQGFKQEIQGLKSREKEYLETIRGLEANNNLSGNYSFSYHNNNPGNSRVNQSEAAGTVAQELNRLGDILNSKDQEWKRKLASTLEGERTANIQLIQSVLSQNMQPSTYSDSGIRGRVDQVHQDSLVFIALQNVMREVEQLKQSTLHSVSASISQQLKLIKQFIVKLQRARDLPSQYLPSQSSGIRDKEDSPQRDIESMLRQQLSQYKSYVKEEEKNKKVFLEELNLYREQNTEIIKENGYLRHRLGAMQMESKNNKNHQVGGDEVVNRAEMMEEQKRVVSQYERMVNFLTSQGEISQGLINKLRENIEEQQEQIEEHERYIIDLEGQLMNTQPKKPSILHTMSHPLEGVEETAQLHLQIQRLNNLLQTEIAQLTEVNTETIRSYQQQIKLYEQRISIYQSTISSNQQAMHQYQTQHSQSNLKTQQAEQSQTVIIQNNKSLQVENTHLKKQVNGLFSANRELQVQIKERSHAVDHLWQVKQAEFENVFSIVNQVKRTIHF